MPSLDDAAELVDIVRQDHTFEFKYMLKDRVELGSGLKKVALGQHSRLGSAGRRSRRQLRYQCEANGEVPPKSNACLKTPEVLQGNQQHVERVFQRNVVPSWLLSPTLDPMRTDRWHQLKHLTHEMT